MINNLLMENFDLDPLNLMDDYFFSGNYFEDGNQASNKVISDMKSTPTTKRNVFQKIWDGIKKIMAWVAKQWGRFTDWIKGLFKKKTKSVDQIIEETIPQIANKINKSSPVKSVKVEFNPTIIDDNKSQGANSNPPIVDSKGNEVKSMSRIVDLAYKDIICKIENDTIIFRKNEIWDNADIQIPKNRKEDYGLDPNKKDYVPVNGTLTSAWKAAIGIYEIIYNSNYSKILNDIINQLKEKIWEDPNKFREMTSFMNNVNTLYDLITNRIRKAPDSFTLNITQINSFNNILNELHKALEFLDNPQTPNPKHVMTFNILSTVAWRLQFGVTLITGSMNKIHEIDAKYVGVINDNETLSKFIEGCLNGNVPTKYIAFNAYAICSNEMRGSANQMKPAMGETRLVLFPSNKDSVTKIAINQFGLRSNKIEDMVYNALKPHNGDNLLAKIEETSTNKCVMSIEKVNTDNHNADYSEISELQEKLKIAIKNANLHIDIVDMHRGNMGRRKDGKLVVSDYGFTER